MSTTSIGSRLRSLGAAALGGALITAGLTAAGPAPSAAAATTPHPAATAAAQWLDGRLEAGLLDPRANQTGSTIDFALSLLATGAAPATLTEVREGVDGILDEYVGAEPDVAKAGPVAKAAHFYAAVDAEPSIPLLQRLEDFVDDETGQLGTVPDVYSQVWAVQALAEAGSDETEAATDFLIAQKCEGGAWGYEWDGCNSDVDATAWTVLALLPQSDDPDVAAAIEDGVDWLLAQQQADGSFGAWGSNSNSTGLAAWALGAAGEQAAAARAAGWIADRQVVALPACGQTSLDTEHGAIAFDDTALTDARTHGIGDAEYGQWELAGAQALAALAYLPATPATVSGPSGYVRAGSQVRLTVRGLRAGETACLAGAGTARRITGPGNLSITLPAGTANRTLRLSRLGGSAQTTVRALGAQRLRLVLAPKVVAGKRVKVTVKGLAVRERVVLTLRGRKVARGTARANGTFVARVAVGPKKGRAVVAATGQFANRKGATAVRVVRR